MYIDCQYVVFGKCEKSYTKQLDDVDLRITNDYPYTGIQNEEYFVLEFGPITLPLMIKKE